ncbi:family 2 encapsulin nanocompartment cargo protein terpene cyclase [Streptomyces sp. NPDC020883]|uniref:family 2 encapsulin nanocompartment cargo protein terpene cyclase n=1 Tax=Streptomyces sp. NPDC020883 TaxID=3365099 RepID=UPI0037946501
MSQLSRMAAPRAHHHVARLVATLLTHGNGIRPPAPKALPGTALRRARTAVPTGPTGLGTSAARITAGKPAAGTSGTAGGHDSGVPELYCPPAMRDDQALGREVNDRLVDWADQVGLYAGRLERVRAADFGRLMMLAHPDSDDPDRLLAAAKCALAEWATDDYYCDDETMGSRTDLLGSHLGPAYAALDPAHLPSGYASAWEQDMAGDPVRVALRAGLWDLAGYADPSQLARLRHEVAVLFVGYGQEGSWRSRGQMPTVREYLAHRQINSFLPCIALVDVVSGNPLAAAEYSAPRVRRAVTMAATASTLVNDLYSMTKEHHSSGVEFNLPTVIAAEEGCTPQEAVERSVAIHDELVRTFETEAAALAVTGSPQLRHFLAGVWAWLGGNREWHSGSLRYHAA